MDEKQYQYKAKVVAVIDGDTFVADIDLGFSIGIREHFRVLNLDTPETFKPRNEAEKLHGMKAKARAVDLLQGKDVLIGSRKKEKYGRYLAIVTLPGGADFANQMAKEGFEKKSNY